MFALVRFTPEREVVMTSDDWQNLRDFISRKATNNARWGMHPWREVSWDFYGTQYFIEEVQP